MDSLTPRQKKSVSFCSDIADICLPLFQFTDVSGFQYVRIYSNGAQISLATRVDWLEYYFQQNHHMFKTYIETPKFLKDGFVYGPSVPYNSLIINASKYFQIGHGLSIIKNSKNYAEIYTFCTSVNNFRILNWYINNIDLMERFVLYFKDQASSIISSIKPIKVMDSKLEKEVNILKQQVEDESNQKLIEMIEPKRITLNYNKTEVILTKAEYRCLNFLMQGYTAKGIAKELSLSSRTVESNIMHIKKKLNCHYKSDLVRICNEIHIPFSK